MCNTEKGGFGAGLFLSAPFAAYVQLVDRALSMLRIGVRNYVRVFWGGKEKEDVKRLKICIPNSCYLFFFGLKVTVLTEIVGFSIRWVGHIDLMERVAGYSALRGIGRHDVGKEVQD